MKIAMIGQKGVPATYGGIERHVEEVGARLVERGHEVLVYTRPYYSPGSSPYRGMRRLPRPSIRTKHLDTATHALVAGVDVLLRGVDLVHFHALGPSALSWLPFNSSQSWTGDTSRWEVLPLERSRITTRRH